MNKSMRRAFTLIELLVVIAIIAILTAIIFPVFASVRENARQSSSLSNMHAISSALGQFQLDNKRNPDVLFGYVYKMYDSGTMMNDGAVVPMDKAYAQAQSDAQTYGTDASSLFPGLYPEYVHDIASFADGNNPDNGNYSVPTPDVTVNILCPSNLVTCTTGPQPTGDDGVLKTKTNVQFYKADAYDISPRVTGTNMLDMTIYVPRYQSSWTDVDNNLNNTCSGTTPATCTNGVNFYTHQMRWKNPPADTYVTSTTYHVPNANIVLVLWEDGSVRKQNVMQFTQYGPDATDISVTGTPGVSAANFWKLTPAQ